MGREVVQTLRAVVISCSQIEVDQATLNVRRQAILGLNEGRPIDQLVWLEEI